MEVLKSIRQDLWLEDFLRNRGLTLKETFAPVSRYTSIRTIMALASMMKRDLHQMYVKESFLNGVIEEEVYIKHPQGFEVKDRANHL